MADGSRIWRPGRARGRAGRLAASLVATLAAAGMMSLPLAAGAAARPAPAAAVVTGELHGVSCSSAGACMAVGDHLSVSGGLGGTLTERWNGADWSVVPSPSPRHFPHAGAELDGVSCVSASDCLAVGWHLFSNSSPRRLPLADRWNGTAWSQVNAPLPSGSFSTSLAAVSCTSATNCWADGVSDSATLTEHWNGTRWSIVPSPNPSPSNGNLLSGVACPAASECWAVGLTTPSSGTGSLTEQWNGTRWSVRSTPSSANGRLAAVACARLAPCLAVGQDDSGFALGQMWNSSRWIAEKPVKPSGATTSDLDAVSCPSDACVAVGQYKAGGPVVSLAEGWSGTTWGVEPTPNPAGATFTFLQGVSCASLNNCWAAGEWGSSSGTHTLTEHWNGHAWSIVA